MTPSAAASSYRRPPASDEIEISLFGAGIGECVVAHLGVGDWIVVDSCLDPKTGRPVALRYLRELGVDVASAVRLVVVTHWHDDHIQGAAALLAEAASAKMVCSGALRTDEFKQLLGAGQTAFMSRCVDEFAQMLRIIRKRDGGRGAAAGPIWAHCNQRIFSSGSTQVYALSPSHATQTLAFRELASGLSGLARGRAAPPKRRLVAQEPNEVSVVLWIECGATKVVLGGDLETNKDVRTGWQAVVTSAERPEGRASILKVPHHGSSTAEEPRMWSELLEPRPWAIMTPHTASALPTEADLRRLAARTDHLYCTAPARGRKPRDLGRAVRKMVEIVAPDMRDLAAGMGHIRLRRKAGAPDQGGELFGRAFHVEAA